MDKIKTPATRITDAELNELLREVVKDEILKDARPTLESLKALHADRPLLVLALSQAIGALNTAADQSRVIEALKTAATNLVNTIEASKRLEAIWIGSNRRDEELEQIVGAKNIVKAALAEAQRVMEGK